MSVLRVLIVEDEALIAMMVEDAVEAHGDIVVASASNIQEALQCAATVDFDVALLDLNLGGQKAHAVPAMVAARHKPFAFVTGYGDSGVLASYAHAPVVTKPFKFTDIAAALTTLAERCVR